MMNGKQRSFTDRSSATDDKFLQERKSRQDEILGFKKAPEADRSESPPKVEEEQEKSKSRARRPSLTRLSDARKRVQERMAKGSGDPTRSDSHSRRSARDVTKELESDEEGEMALKDDYDAMQLKDRSSTSLVQRVSDVVKTPEKSRRKMLGSKSLSATAPLVGGGTKSNWDL